VAILIYKINEDTSSGIYIGGYFWLKDYLADVVAQQQGMRSNEMDIIYIRGNNPNPSTMTDDEFYNVNLSTLVHEHQHLVHFGKTVWHNGNLDFNYKDDTWINEMMSGCAETMYFKDKINSNSSYTHPSMVGNGYLKDRILRYMIDPQNKIRDGYGLTFWNSTQENYSLVYIFGQYLALQSNNGQGIFKNILDYMLQNSVYDYRAVEGVAKQRIAGVNSWETLSKSWGFANSANEATGLYGYKGQFKLITHGPTQNEVDIHNSGVVYRNINGSFTPPTDAGPNIRFYVYPPDASATTTVATTTVAHTSTTTSSSGGGGGGGGTPTTTTSIPIVTTTIAPQTTTTTVQASSTSTSSVQSTTTTTAPTECNIQSIQPSGTRIGLGLLPRIRKVTLALNVDLESAGITCADLNIQNTPKGVWIISCAVAGDTIEATILFWGVQPGTYNINLGPCGSIPFEVARF
jgi:hypothetical protein